MISSVIILAMADMLTPLILISTNRSPIYKIYDKEQQNFYINQYEILNLNEYIKGEKKEQKKEKDHNYHRVERSYGMFQRTFSLPMHVESDKVKAAYKDGVLTITLPKKEEVKPKEISISVS